MNLSTNVPDSQAPAAQVPDLNRSTVIALDLGTITGFALRAADSNTLVCVRRNEDLGDVLLE